MGRKSLKSMCEDIKDDIKYLETEYGTMYDFCGGYCNSEPLWDMINNPTQRQAYETLLEMVTYNLRAGYDNKWVRRTNDFDSKKDIRVAEMFKKYNVLDMRTK